MGAADPLFNPLLERLAFLETANDGLKNKLSAGGFNADLQNLALAEQLASAKAEAARHREALDNFCRETLATSQARDAAQSAAEESLKALDAAVQERDALHGRLEALEVELDLARRAAGGDEARRLIDELEAKLALERRAAQETEGALNDRARENEAEAAERLRALAAASAEREASLLQSLAEDRKAVEDHRRLLEEAERKLESARREAETARLAARESSRNADEEIAMREKALAREFADREAPLLKVIENNRRLLEELKLELEHALRREQEAARALREAEQKAQSEAEERLRALTKTSAQREAAMLEGGEEERRRLAAMAVDLERTRRAAQDAEETIRESSRKAFLEAQADAAERMRKLTAEFAEREAMLLKTAENDRRRLEVELASRDAKEADRLYRESQRKSLPVLQAEFAGREALILKAAENDRRLREAMEAERASRDAQSEDRLRRLAAEFADREAQLQKAAETERRRLQTAELELRRARLEAHDALRAADAEKTDRLNALVKEITEREALFLKTNADDRKLLEQLKLELDAERAAARGAERALHELEQARIAAPPTPPEEQDLPNESAATAAEGAAAFISPSLDPVLDPGWARLLRLVRPPVESAYAHLRRLSSTALTAGQKTLLRMAAASIASASDSLSSIELALEEGPAPGAPAPLLPVLEGSLAAWEAAFRGRGVALAREFSPPVPETAYNPKELRITLHHVLRNALEAVPRGGRLTVRAGRGPDGGLRVEFADDGPGFPAEWLARRFEPFAAPRRGRAGLGLSIVRRTLRRWGGDAEAANAKSGRGARLTLLFAPPPPPSPPIK